MMFWLIYVLLLAITVLFVLDWIKKGNLVSLIIGFICIVISLFICHFWHGFDGIESLIFSIGVPMLLVMAGTYIK